MQSCGDERIKKIVAALADEGIKIFIATDIWSSYSYVCAYSGFTIYFLGYLSTVYFGQVRTQ